MTTLDLVLPGDVPDADDYVALAQRGEELGFARASVPEVTGRDGATLLAALAAETDRIGLSNSVFSPYSRSPALLGQTAVTLAELSGGRYRMGLGTSSPALAERWHGEPFDRPLRRLREAIEVVRQVMDGGSVDYDGDCFDLGGLSLSVSPPDEPVPLDVAALGPKAVELAGRFGDGWVPQLFTPAGLEDRMADLRRGAELGDRSSDGGAAGGDPAAALRVSPTLRCCATDDPEVARGMARRQLAFMVGAYGPYYRESIARQGHADVTEAVHDAWQAGERGRAVEAIPDALLDDLVAAGTPEDVRGTVERFAAVDGVDAVRVGFLGEMGDDDRRATMEAVAELTDEA